ncbi:MAG: UDP-N-acetylmuramoyl-tripeptide--D-alanyl-D-alanine ligase [Candidatus Omnitrophica bacterium]|nr:UDP-N-acetylmuramoyl-tripeptide--D-alanyl-D-alanine ligase [Candidatus Omnitrophota bacterium]
MSKFTIEEIVGATSGRLLQGRPKAVVRGVSTDTRKITKGQLFVAIKGDNFDGNNFTAQAVAAGAAAVVVSRKDVTGAEDIPVILVDDTTKALGQIARFHRRRFKIPVIAITGSAGKTTTKEFIAAVLGKKFKVLFNKGTENNHVGVPGTLLQLDKTHKVAVLELGTNHFGEISWLAEIAEPTVAVFTNIGASHLAGLGDPQGVLREKSALIDFLPKKGTVILNADDPLLLRIRARKLSQKVITYAIDHAADVKITAVKAERGGLNLTLTSGEKIHLKTPVWGNILNALAATACGRLFRISFADIRSAILATKAARGRQCFHSVGGVTVIDDTYNANPVSFKNALRTLSLIPRKGRAFVLGADMLELGDRSEELHAEVGQAAAQSGVDHLWTVGRWAGLIGARAAEINPLVKARHFIKREDILPALAAEVRPGDVVLAKGSRGMKMETVVEGLVEFLDRKGVR